MAEEGRADIAEVAAGHAHHKVVGLAQCLHSGVCIEIIECLRQETGHIDAVGWGQLHVLVQFLIHKSRLHQRLTIVKDTIHLNSGNVLAQGGKLALLNGRDFSFGVEHIDVDALYAQETVGYGTSRVAACSHKDVDRPVCWSVTSKRWTTSAQEITQQTCHKPGTYILEGKRRTVEQFQRVDIFCHFHHRTVEWQGVIDNVLQGVFVHIFSEEIAGYVIGNILELHILDVVEEGLGQFLDALRHV